MPRSNRFLAVSAAVSLFAAAASAAFAQTSVRAPADVSGLRMGVPCDTANGFALGTDAAGNIVCTNRVSSADTAATASSATTATNALNAVNATTLTGTLNASQISGALSANQVQGALPTCTSGQVLTNINGAMSCVTTAGNGNGVLCQGQSLSASHSLWPINPSSGAATGSVASRGTASSLAVTLTSAGEVAEGVNVNGSCSTTATCNANGTWTFTTCSGSYGFSNGQSGSGYSSAVTATPN